MDQPIFAAYYLFRRGRDLGFSINVIRTMLNLAEHPEQPCADANKLTVEHLAKVEKKIAELERLRTALHSITNCHAHCVAECRIIDALADI